MKKYFITVKLEDGHIYHNETLIFELSYEELQKEQIFNKIQKELERIGATHLKIIDIIDMKAL